MHTLALSTVCTLLALAPAVPGQGLPSAELDPDGPLEHRPPHAPAGEVYTDQHYAGNFDQPIGLIFDAAGRLFVAEKEGRVWVLEDDGTKPTEPLVDIGEEVGNYGSSGLLGFTLDPNFTSNGYLYLFYTVDYHHLMNFGTPSYDPLVSEDFFDTISRITRYTVLDPDPQLHGHELELDVASRLILLGESLTTGIPACSYTHGAGTLAFGTDGSLLASHGDGSQGELTPGNCLSDGILLPKQDVMSFRAQLRDSMNGKVLRLDPQTGDGVANNPFFDPLDPRSPRSRVWSMGLRQPFRMAVRPGTGGPAHPGSLYIGDVGASSWEEISVARDGGQNFGWPIYEGMLPTGGFGASDVANLDASNPLFGQTIPGQGLCDQEFFFFGDLIAQDSLAPFPDLPNPCDPSAQVPLLFQSTHTRPAVAWAHDVPITHVPKYFHGLADFDELGVPGTLVAGEAFPGNASIGGVWYDGDDFPAQYKGTYFQSDYGEPWIRSFRFNGNDQLVEVLEFTDDAPGVSSLTTHPTDGGIYYLRYSSHGTVRKITFTGNAAPVALATPDLLWGPGPLSVQFDASESYDPLGEALTYEWDFDDGSPDAFTPQVTHVFASTGEPEVYEVTLTVSDPLGQESETTVIVGVDASPPTAEILTPLNGQLYPADQAETIPLASLTGDAETPDDLECFWQVTLIHDNHGHPDPGLEDCDEQVLVGPHTDPGDLEYYVVELTVTDEQGLTATDTHYLLREDDCNLNGFADADDIAQGVSLDVNLDGIPDECAGDCDGDGLSDLFAIFLDGDCNANGVPDGCENDFDGDGTPDTCQQFSVDIDAVSLTTGGRQDMTISVGTEHAGGLYWVLGTLGSQTPGIPFGPVTLPLTWDVYFTATLTGFNSPPLIDSVGFLDLNGAALAALDLPPGLNPGLAGLTATHTAMVLNSSPMGLQHIQLVTNTMPLHLLP